MKEIICLVVLLFFCGCSNVDYIKEGSWYHFSLANDEYYIGKVDDEIFDLGNNKFIKVKNVHWYEEESLVSQISFNEDDNSRSQMYSDSIFINLHNVVAITPMAVSYEIKTTDIEDE